jgi:hypothetical protein
MKTTKLLIAFLAIFAISSYAATAAELKTTIESYRGGGTGSLSVAIIGSQLTVTGQLTGVSDELDLDIDAGLRVIWKASLTGTAAEDGQSLIYTIGTGIFEVQSGKIEQTNNCDDHSGHFIAIDTGGKMTISGGEVNSRCIAVVVYDGGTVTINGGTISGREVAVESYGLVNISGGTVSTDGGDGSHAVYNGGGTVIISGGTVSATTGYAIYNYNVGDGIVTISGGLVFAYYDLIDGLGIIYNDDGFPISGNAVILAWDNAAGTTTYMAGTNTDIVKAPDAATAVWDVRGGIAYTNGTNTGFVKVAGVTVSAGSPIIPQIANSNIRIQAIGNAILLENLPKNSKVELYNLQGKQIYSTTSHSSLATNHLKIDVQTKGMYVIKIGTQTTRVAVR